MNTKEQDPKPISDPGEDTTHTDPEGVDASDVTPPEQKKAWSLEDWVNGGKGGDFRVRSTLTGYRAIR